MNIQITGSEAEEILIGLAHRSRQNGVRNSQHSDEIRELGNRLATIFSIEYGWAPGMWKSLLSIPLTVVVKVKK